MEQVVFADKRIQFSDSNGGCNSKYENEQELLISALLILVVETDHGFASDVLLSGDLALEQLLSGLMCCSGMSAWTSLGLIFIFQLNKQKKILWE